MRYLLSIALIITAMNAIPAAAQNDTAISYQGVLRDGGVGVTDTCDVQFRLYDALSGGNQIGTTITKTNVNVADGLFTVELDFGAAAFDNSDRWLRIDVRCPAGSGTYTTLNPRQAITRSPYSIQTRGIVVDEFNNVGIGTTTPLVPLHVESDGQYSIYGYASASTGSTYGVFGASASTSGTGVFGWAGASTGSTTGVYGQSASTSGRGVYGRATASTGLTYGVQGESASTSGRGVFGWAGASTGSTYGVWGQSNSTSGRGVYGLTTASTGFTYGVRGQSESTSGGHGVYGLATANTGVNYGVVGLSASPSGFDFFASGAGTNYGASSSRRWKSNVVAISDPLAKLAQLRGVYFDWDEEHGGHHDLGMIAEEVGAVLPEIVNYEENGIDAIGMDYSKMTPLLVEAVNALRVENESEIVALRAENVAMRAESESLRERLASLEQMVQQLTSINPEESK